MMSDDLIKREDAIRTVCECECYSGYNPCEEGKGCYAVNELRKLPSADRPQVIDIIHCNECKWEWTQKCPPHRMGLIHDASDYCSYGIRKTDGVDKHDEAVEALGHLIKHMKGADE